MAITIDIYIHGLAALYRKDEAWKVVFLSEKTASNHMHRLFFRWKKEGDGFSEEVSLVGKEGFQIVEYGADPLTEYKGTNYKKIFNLNSIYAHRGNLRLIEPTKWSQFIMVFPHSQLDTKFLTMEEYGIRKHEENKSKAHPIGKVAEIVKLTISSKTGKINIPDEEPIPLKNDETYVINLDNSCDKCVMPQGENDFEVYYEMVEDKVDKNLRFIAGRMNRPMTKIIPDGNCDPAVIDPPPSGDNE